MGYNQFSQLVTNAPKFTDPLSEGVLMRGAMFQEENAQLAKRETQADLDAIFGIKPMSIQDEKVLRQKQAELQEALKGVNMSQLANPQTAGQIKSIINQFKNDPDVLAPAMRSAQVTREQQARKEAEEKGLPYYSRALEDADEYSNSGIYLRDKRFSNTGFVGRNLSKARNEALEKVPKEKYMGKDGFYHERYNQRALDEALNAHYSDPVIKKQLLYDIENKHKNRNWEDEGIAEISNYAATAQQLYNEALQQGDMQKAQELEQDINMYNQMIQDPQGYGEQIKQTVYNQEFQDRIALDKAHSNFNSTEKANEYALKEQDFRHNKELARFKAQLDAGEIPGIKGKMSELDKAVYTAVVSSGKPIYDVQGQLIPAKDLASQVGVQYNPKESMDNKSAGKDATTPDTKILVGKKEYKQSEALANIEIGNKEFIKEAIKTFFEPLEGEEDIKIDGDYIYYEKAGVKGSNSFGWDKKIKKETLINKIKGNNQSSQSTGSGKYKGLDSEGNPIFE